MQNHLQRKCAKYTCTCTTDLLYTLCTGSPTSIHISEPLIEFLISLMYCKFHNVNKINEKLIFVKINGRYNLSKVCACADKKTQCLS